MYKTKLQEFGQQRHWGLPIYSSNRDGPDHQPRFKATVLVNGVSFDSPNLCPSSKEAQNEAARIAFEHFTHSTASSSCSLSPSQLPASKGSSSASTILKNSTSGEKALLRKKEEPLKTSPSHGTALGVKGDTEFGVIDAQFIYKSQLQTYAQKRSLSLPVYSCTREGSSHAPRFQAKVTVDGQTFETLEFYRTLREAEHAAARVAFSSLSKAGSLEGQEDGCVLYKNLLQELAQKEGLSTPVYTTTTSGASHVPTFTSNVQVEGELFHGAPAKTKKQAEINSAKVAYFSYKDRQLKRTPLPIFQSFNIEESTITVDFQQKLNLGGTSNSTPTIKAEKITNKVDTNADRPTTSPLKPVTGFERVGSPSPTVPETKQKQKIDTNELLSSGKESNTDLPPLLCNRVAVYPRKPDMKFREGDTVLPISDNQFVAVRLGCQSK